MQRGKSLGSNSRKGGGTIPKRQFSMMNKLSTHNIVVVKPAVNTEAMDKDPDLLQLQVRSIDIFHSMEMIVDIACYEVKVINSVSSGALSGLSVVCFSHFPQSCR